MSKVAHLIGNGKTSALYKPQKGLKITCNVPPFEVANVYTTVMVDFKMMKAISTGTVQGCDEVHLYGFDSLFSFDTTSMSDLFLQSDRGDNQTVKLTSRWRPIWDGIFKEFSDTQFVLYDHKGDTGVMKFPKNVEVRNGK